MGGLVRPFVVAPAKHLLRLVSDPEYRAVAALESRLGSVPRFASRRVKVRDLDLEVPDVGTFLATYRNVFVDRAYAFRWSESRPPRILDLGANIGLSALWFRRAHPGARILAVEADPAIFAFLERNLKANGADDVERLPRAAWSEPTRLTFRPDGADGGRLDDAPQANAPGPVHAVTPFEVETVAVPDLLRRETFDVVKMDIEGAERVVLPACRDALGSVSRLMIEYHSSPARPQALGIVLGMLEDAGFRVHVHTGFTSPHPLEDVGRHEGWDLQLHLYAWRPEATARESETSRASASDREHEHAHR
jgi:FkbM family methyltransferase